MPELFCHGGCGSGAQAGRVRTEQGQGQGHGRYPGDCEGDHQQTALPGGAGFAGPLASVGVSFPAGVRGTFPISSSACVARTWPVPDSHVMDEGALTRGRAPEVGK